MKDIVKMQLRSLAAQALWLTLVAFNLGHALGTGQSIAITAGCLAVSFGCVSLTFWRTWDYLTFCADSLDKMMTYLDQRIVGIDGGKNRS